MRTLTLITIVLTLGVGACAPADRDTRPEPQAAEDWIEVPLAPNTYREYSAGFRQDTVDIAVPAGVGLEYKLAMREGESIVYTWQVSDMDDPELLTAEFHGHTERAPDAPGTVMFYRKATGATESGALIAPFDGIHGWYLRNDSDTLAVVQLTVAGFYDLVPD